MKKLATVLLILLISTPFLAQEFDFEWQNPTPTGNTINDMVFNPAGELVTVGEASEIKISGDNGETWTIIRPVDDNVDLESIHYVDANIAYVAGASGVVLKTTDGGYSWMTLDAGTDVHFWDIEFEDANTGYAVGVDGYMTKTTDGGQNWSSVTTPLDDIYSIEIVGTDVWIGGYDYNVDIYFAKSTDGGANWTDMTSATLEQDIRDIVFIDANTGYLGCSSGQVYKTTDGGANWTNLIDFGSGSIYHLGVVSADVVYAPNSGDVQVTTDGGANWTNSADVSPENLQAIAIKTSATAIQNASKAQAPPSEIVAVGGYDGSMYKTTDAAGTWVALFDFVSTDTFRGITFFNNMHGIVGGDGYLLETTDGGETWAQMAYDFLDDVYSIAAPTDDIWYVGNGSNGIFKTTDAGANWTVQTSPIADAGLNIYGMEFVDANNGYIGAEDGIVLKTTDGGTTWTELTTPMDANIFDIAVIDVNTVVTAGMNNQAYRTTDGGTNWTGIFTGNPGNYFGVEFYDANYGVMTSWQNPSPYLAETTDGGATWTSRALPAEYDVFSSIWAIGIYDMSTLWVADVQGNLGFTTDAGATWELAKPVTSNGVYGFAIVGEEMWMAGSGGSILKGFANPAVPVELSTFSAVVSGNSVKLDWTTATEKNNSGFEIERKYAESNWEKIAFVEGKGTTSEISRYTFVDNPAASGNVSYRLKQVDYDGTYEYSQAVEVNLAAPESFELSQNYPNPFNPSTTINYAIPARENVTVKIYNALGMEVTTIVNKVQEAGKYSIDFNAEGLSSGIYFYNITAGEFSKTMKMILLK